MAKRGRPAKAKTTETVSVMEQNDYVKLRKQFEQEQQVQIESLYKDLAKVKYQLNSALSRVGNIDSCENLGEAAFKAGLAYGPLDEANDRLEEILESIFSENDLDHWDDVNN
jgi:serine protease inhibitor